MEAFLISAGVVALAELGDKTQLLALLLAARFRAPLPVIAGITTAVLVNHLLAGAVGTLLATLLAPQVLRWMLVASFIATAVWMLIPDRQPARRQALRAPGGLWHDRRDFLPGRDGRQDADRDAWPWPRSISALASVVAGTTLGMLIADVPAVMLGRVVAERIPMALMHRIGAAVFVVLAVLALL